MAFSTKRDLIEQEVKPALGEWFDQFEQAGAIDKIIDEAYELTDRGYVQRDGVDFWSVVEDNDPGDQEKVAEPVMFDYRKEVYIGDEYEEIGVYSFDAADILGAMDTDELLAPDDLMEYGDSIVLEAVEAGIIDDPRVFTALGGPGYDDYFAGRQNGEIQPNKVACEKEMLKKKIDHAVDSIDKLHHEIDVVKFNSQVYKQRLAELSDVEKDVEPKSLDEMMSVKCEEAEFGDDGRQDVASEQNRE